MVGRIDVISYAMQACKMAPCMTQTHMAHSSTLQILHISLNMPVMSAIVGDVENAYYWLCSVYQTTDMNVQYWHKTGDAHSGSYMYHDIR
jgi:hypothetical protein